MRAGNTFLEELAFELTHKPSPNQQHFPWPSLSLWGTAPWNSAPLYSPSGCSGPKGLPSPGIPSGPFLLSFKTNFPSYWDEEQILKMDGDSCMTPSH